LPTVINKIGGIMELKVKKLRDDAIVPSYNFDGDSGFDLVSLEYCELQPKSQTLIKTGLAFEIPYGYEMQIRPRSGLALRHGITLTNSPATIDSNYRGEVGVIVYNLGDYPFKINKGDRIAQAVICPVVYVDIKEVNELTDTNRGGGGYGSTGVKVG
jgi:dUTP pyrophosphatase